MSFVVGFLLVIVSLVGAFVVARVVQQFVSASPALNWEYLIVVLIGAAILIWPVARQASLRGAEKKLEQYRQILELKDLESYRLVKTDSGETLEIVADQESGEIVLRPAKASEPKPSETAQPTVSATPAPSASPQVE